MKKITLLLSMFFLVFGNYASFGQGVWNPQTNPTTDSGESMQFVSATEGWISLNSNALLHTVNGGSTWTVVTPEPSEISFGIDAPGSRLSFANATTGYVLKNKTNPDAGVSTAGVLLYKTTDGGANWQKTVLSTVAGDAGIQVQFTDVNHGWVLIFNMSTMNATFLKTTDGGANWLPANGAGIFQYLNNNLGYAFSAAPNMLPPYTIYKTVDGGTNWTTLYTDSTEGEINAMYFVDANNGWLVGTNGKIFKTTNGGVNWTAITTAGLTSNDKNNNVFFVNATTGWIGNKIQTMNGDHDQILHTNDGGITWTRQTSLAFNSKVFCMYFTDASNGWAAIDGGNLAKYSISNTVYNNASLNGPWLYYTDVNPIDPFNDNLGYIIFDGQGNITGFNGFGNPTNYWGNYTVYPNGQFTGVVSIGDESFTLGGTITSATEGIVTSPQQFLMHKVANPGALSESISGTLSASNGCGSRTITFNINNNGEVTGSSGIDGPVTGNIYADLGVFVGHFKTGDLQHGWNEFSVFGNYSDNNLIGQLSLDSNSGPGTCNENTSAILVRTGSLSVNNFNSDSKKLTFYPNPSDGNFNFYIIEPKAKLNISIYNFVGQKVFETTNTNMKNENIIPFQPSAKGMYLIKVFDGKKEFSEKIIIE